MIRFLKKRKYSAFFFFVSFSFLCLFLFGYRNNNVRAILVDVREAVFTREIVSDDIWSVSPKKLRNQYAFKIDSKIDRKSVSSLVEKYVDIQDKNLKGGKAFFVISSILNKLYYNPPGQCGYFDDLSTRLKYLTMEDSKISGCCSDYAEVFIAIAVAHNYEAREVRKSGHVFAEIYMPNEHKWVWVDPQFSLTASIVEKTSLLSLIQLRNALLKGQDVVFYNHKTKQMIAHSKLPQNISRFYKVEDFRNIKMLQGNAIWAEDMFNKKHNNFPKPLRQIYSYIMGARPYTLSYDGDK